MHNRYTADGRTVDIIYFDGKAEMFVKMDEVLIVLHVLDALYLSSGQNRGIKVR